MSETMRYRSDSVVSIDEPALQLGLNGEAVMEETVLEMLQTNNVEELRKIDADALALATTAKTYALHEACEAGSCLLYTSPSPRDRTRSRMPSSA